MRTPGPRRCPEIGKGPPVLRGYPSSLFTQQSPFRSGQNSTTACVQLTARVPMSLPPRSTTRFTVYRQSIVPWAQAMSPAFFVLLP